MQSKSEQTTPWAVTFERSYQASVADLWNLWTTKEGFESWWGPQGFRVEVHRIEPCVGGALAYDMIAVGGEEIEMMKRTFGGASHATHGSFTHVVPMHSLEIVHVIDFIPGMRAYDNRMRVEFFAEGKMARMVIRVQDHASSQWTQASRMGMESQLTKVPGVLAARHGRQSPAYRS
jgi:uncharacterized protein YndB with AHSA1/START domain